MAAKDCECSLEDESSWLSYIVLSFLNPMYAKGSRQTLEQDDLGVVSKQDRCDLLYERFAVHWQAEEALPLAKRSLWRALFRTVGYGKFFLALFLYFIYSAENFGPVLILNVLVDYFDGNQHLSTGLLWMLVALMFLLPMTGAVLAAHSNLIMNHIGLQFRNILINKIYRKSLLLSPAAKQVSSTGQIINMFSTDTLQMQTVFFYANNGLVAIPTIIVALFLIYQLVGTATFVGLGLIILSIPLNAVVFMQLNGYRKKKTLVSDQRVKLMNELLNGIRVLKFYAWEAAFKSTVQTTRHRELILLKHMAYLGAITLSMALNAVPTFMPVLIFFTYVKQGHTLDAAKAFTALSLFNLMQFPFFFVPAGLSQYSQATVAMQRISQLIAADELKAYVNNAPRDDGNAIVLQDVRAGWVQEEELGNMDMLRAAESPPSPSKDVEYSAVPADGSEQTHRSIETLRSINLTVKKGELVAVIGPVGCGKSSLFSSILGELNLLSGSVAVDGSVAYCDQRPWILNDSVEGNILFGQGMKEAQFDETLHASCLEDDIKVLPGGLQTQIGEKGINLSGGQKARVALARAIYKNADIYLLDDPLSAVDAHVAQFLFHECICRSLAGKTRVLVTHQVHLLPHVDRVIVLVNGAIKAQGTYQEILRSGIDLSTLAATSKEAAGCTDDALQSPVSAAAVIAAEDGESTEVDGVAVDVSDANRSPKEDDHFLELRQQSSMAAKLRKEDSRSAALMTTEERQEGQVSWECYAYYIRSGGLCLFSMAILAMIVSQVFVLLTAFWLQYWGTQAGDREDEQRPLSSDANIWYLNIFAALSSITLFFLVIRALILAEHRMGASQKLHDGVLTSTLQAPVAFFDTTPTGRILNRFSSDLKTMDEDLSDNIAQVINCSANCLGAIGAIAGATKGTFLVLLAPMAYFYYKLQNYYLASNTAIARLESVSRSPIYADFSQTLAGMTSIRAYGEQQRCVNMLEQAVNINSIASITRLCGSQWLSMRLDVMGSLVSFFIAAIAAATSSSDFLPAGFVALGLTYSFQMTAYLKYVVRMTAIMEANMNSVERIRFYMNEIDQEKEVVAGETIIPSASWPDKGVIEVEGLQMRYRDGPLVLKAVDFTTISCEKIGIAGRTGSGKSSLMIALFRIQELAGGKITIDGIDTGSVPLHILRSRLGIIPQDPVMFSASIRFNLDPFDQYSDEAIWDMLERVNMKNHVMSLPNKLLHAVAEGGENFSVGQRQLICIGRAILRKPKILILDEATASIDNENDNHIQRMVREQFEKCTVLTIAHRLNTIIDSDRIMVLDNGVLKELDAPSVLLDKEDGLFKMLWEKHLHSHGHKD